MRTKPLSEILKRIKSFRTDPVDLVVGIVRGGIIPAYLVASHLGKPLEFLWIHFRDEHHKPELKKPRLEKPINFEWNGKRVLLVDDRVNSGATIHLAKQFLSGAKSIQTFAVNGPADYTLFDEERFNMPWDLSSAR